MTPIAFYDFCCQNIKNIEFVFTTYSDYDEESKLLSDRHSEAITIAGTQKLHFFQPVSLSEVSVKEYTDSPSSYVKKVAHFDSNSLESTLIKNYVVVEYMSDWWVGFVMEKEDCSKMAKVNFLHPRGPARSFVYPSQSDILDVPYSDILCEADVSTVTGRTYTMIKSCQDKASNILKSRN